MTEPFPSPAWLVGCGNMAGAMVEGWRAGGIDLAGVTVIRPSGTPVEGVSTRTDYPDEVPRFVMLGFKPQLLDEVAPSLAPHIVGETILVSMLAGVTAATLSDRFPDALAIVRIMPNLPVAQVQGVIGLFAEQANDAERTIVQQTMSWLGMIAWCDDEAMLAAIGVVAASGPAYVARFAAALAHGGEALGLRPGLANSIAVQTLVGTGAMVAATGSDMAELSRRVASSKATTEQGLAVLDAEDGLQPLIDRMLAAAIRRGEELAAAARAN